MGIVQCKNPDCDRPVYRGPLAASTVLYVKEGYCYACGREEAEIEKSHYQMVEAPRRQRMANKLFSLSESELDRLIESVKGESNE